MNAKSVDRSVAAVHENLAYVDRVRAWSPSAADFLDGILTPSVIAIGTALLLNFIASAAAVLIMTPNFIARHGADLLAQDRTDYDMFATAKLLNLSQRPVQKPFVAILGGSTTRAALLESDIAEQLNAMGLSDHEVFNLCTNRQSLWQTLAIVEHLPPRGKGTVIIGLGPSLFAMDKAVLKWLSDNPRLGLRSSILDEASRGRGLSIRPVTGNHFIDNMPFLLARSGAFLRFVLTGRKADYVETRFLSIKPASDEFWRKRAASANKRLLKYEDNFPSNLAILRRVIQTIKSRTDASIVLVEAPINPRFLTEFQHEQLIAGHKTAIHRFAAENFLEYVVLNEKVHLEEDDFFDWAHLNDRAAMKQTAAAVSRHIQTAIVPPTDSPQRDVL